MREKDWTVLSEAMLFRGYPKEKLPRLTEEAKGVECMFHSGDSFFLTENGKSRIGVVLSGKLKVYSSSDNTVLLNQLEQGSLFGVSSLYGTGGADTHLVSQGESKVIFFPEDGLELLWADASIRKNLICFLTDRIVFLNKKIASFTAPDAEGKLTCYITDRADENGKFQVKSYSDLAKALGLGRASLYRAMEQMEGKGLLKKDGKTLYLLSTGHNKMKNKKI